MKRFKAIFMEIWFTMQNISTANFEFLQKLLGNLTVSIHINVLKLALKIILQYLTIQFKLLLKDIIFQCKMYNKNVTNNFPIKQYKRTFTPTKDYSPNCQFFKNVFSIHYSVRFSYL